MSWPGATPHWAAGLSPSALAAVATAVATAAWIAYRLVGAVARLLLTPLYYRSTAEHLLSKAPSRRGLVTRNRPRGEAATTAGGNEPPPLNAPYPNGWFFVDQSDAISPGQVRHVSMLGLELAVFRDTSGQVHALDAYCPHLGANIAIGGQVVDDCLECPFHAWRFRGNDGSCQHIPGAEKVPSAAHTRSWRLLERNGAILLWHHADDAEPDWYPPQMEELAVATQVCGRSEHIAYTLIDDMLENGADEVHFETVHQERTWAGSDLRNRRKSIMSSLIHCYNVTSSWRPLDPPDDYMAHVAMQHYLKFRDRKLPLTMTETSVTQIGPAIVYLSELERRQGGHLMSCSYIVPEEPYKQRVTNITYSPPGMLNRVLGKILHLTVHIQLERDIHIWNNKCIQRKPVFAATSSDEKILRFRRWYSKFYPSSSNKGNTKNKVCVSKQDALNW